jgi:diguanylate cyclase (GGDEF)-like protein
MASQNNQRLIDRSSSETHQKWLHEHWLEKVNNLTTPKLINEIVFTIDTLEQEKIRDALTGAFNRGFMGAVLGQEIALTQSSGQELGFILIDIDHFKSINDQEPDGHAAGDRTLVELVKLLREVCGPQSLVGRWGGEEFVIITPHATVDSLLEVADDIGRTIGGWLAKNAKLVRSNVTCSMGIVLARHNELPKDLMDRADKLLYEAKHTGRNQMHFQNNENQVSIVKFN